MFIELLATDVQRKSAPVRSLINVEKIISISDWIQNGKSVGCILVIRGIPDINHFTDLYADVKNVLTKCSKVFYPHDEQ
jgi:hypothetical protein